MRNIGNSELFIGCYMGSSLSIVFTLFASSSALFDLPVRRIRTSSGSNLRFPLVAICE